ncbi:MAG: DegT/DnrJ/EryC1/StrS aminotransferase family protein [Spirochaetales bacterium]|nr:DegT/DnrJ/EryC1/StrS aminotransferase family protein [Spirochaetales bacterium]
MDAVLTCMVSDRVTSGPFLEDFVKLAAAFTKTAGGIGLCSYVSSILCAFEILELVSGDSVIISPLAPSVYMSAFKQKGIQPIFCDVDPHSGLLLPADVEPLLEQKPKAIILHHSLGYIHDLDRFSAMEIPLIEDITQSLGGMWNNMPVGSFGTVSLCSLSEENLITGGGGGLLLVKKRQHIQVLKRVLESTSEYVQLFDLNAAVAYSQMRELETFLSIRKEYASVFFSALQRSRHSILVQAEPGEQVPYSFPICVETSMKDVRQFAKKKGIDTHAAFNESLITMDDEIYNKYPNAKSLLLRCVLFPLYPTLGKKNAAHIAKVLSALP